ncbi:MAG: valine--tRNA ligase [Planctomycetes bacterium]|nr:valine--tRNA ligase [Planctomycetota bacterium]
MELATRYDPREIESRWYGEWEEKGLFAPDLGRHGAPFSIVIPPPNVTGILHMGHGLNNTFQDLVIRWRRMQGRPALWLPGTDHAGIATQNVVEKMLRKEEKKSRHDLGREAFVARIWQWKEHHGGIIIRQLRRLGSSCDWCRERFTMDAGLSKAVEEVFLRLHEKGLVYRGKYLIHWCPRCQTALSDEESIPAETDGNLWFIRYPLADGKGHITVATTRPETMLGDTAVAVNPGDPRYRALVGKRAVLPFLGRELPIVADDAVEFGESCPECGERYQTGTGKCPRDGRDLDPEFGTGALKVTPAHDPADFEIGKRHDLPAVDIFHPDARVNENGGEFAGLDRFEARKRIVSRLEEMGLLEKTVEHRHSIPRCQRCETVIEPRLSTQWNVRMKPLAERAIQAHHAGEVVFHPERWGNYYLRWMEGIRDWCISRQLWWGHRIPAWYCTFCDAAHMERTADGSVRFGEAAAPVVSRGKPTTCPKCRGAELVQDEDVLDTWFSSWLWPFSTMGWPEKTPDLETFYPTNVLVTAPDIIFFWVARMIMAGYEFTGKRPFSDVFITSMVCDEDGCKMSKSRGNVIDPLAMIEKYSADALRFSLVILTSEGQDTRISEQKIEQGRNFCTKLWNAARLLLGNLQGLASKEGGGGSSPPPEQDRPDSSRLEDRWILSLLGNAIRTVDRSLANFRFNEALQALYELFWSNFCDWWLEIAKPRMRGDEGEAARQTALAMGALVLDRVLRLLHPFVPFITEEIWQRLKEKTGRGPEDLEYLMSSPYPGPESAPAADPEAEAAANLVFEVVREIRNVRAKYKIEPRREVSVSIVTTGAEVPGLTCGALAALRKESGIVRRMAGAGKLALEDGTPRPARSAAVVAGGVQIYVELGDVIDLEKEVARLQKSLDEKTRHLGGVERKLQDPSFAGKAPAQVIERERLRAKTLQAELEALRRELAEIK